MRKSLITSSVVAAALLSTSAFAAAMSDTSTIKALDKAHHQITLNDGRMFTVPTNWKFGSYKVGQKVQVTYTSKNGKMVASKVTSAS